MRWTGKWGRDLEANYWKWYVDHNGDMDGFPDYYQRRLKMCYHRVSINAIRRACSYRFIVANRLRNKGNIVIPERYRGGYPGVIPLPVSKICVTSPLRGTGPRYGELLLWVIVVSVFFYFLWGAV